MTGTEGITLLGTEMLTWSDLEGGAGGFGGLLAPHLLHGFGGARDRVLIAGPTTADVVRDVAAQFVGADLLVRSFLDAQQLRAELPDAIEIICGPLDRMAARGLRYDAVVAVGGTDRLHSAEDQTPSVATVLADLVALVADGGELYVGVGNPVGIDRLLSLDPGGRHQDAAWPDGHVPHGPEPTVGSVLDLCREQHGLHHVETWFCHGRRTAPLVAASAAALAAATSEPVVLRALAHAYDHGDAATPTLKDPAGTVADLARSGLAAQTAPLAVAHLRRQPGGPADNAAILVSEPPHPGAVAVRLTRTSTGWDREVLGDRAPTEVTPDLHRDPAALDGPVPPGPSLADEIEVCCSAHDGAEIAVLARRYRDWLGDSPAAPVAADRVAVLPHQIAVTGDGLALLDPSLTAGVPATRDVVLLRGLLDVGADLVERGVRHPWSPTFSGRQIASAMATAAGIEDPAPVIEEALALDRLLRPGADVPDYDDPAGVRALSYAELLEVSTGLAERATEAEVHIVWLLERLQSRQRMLRFTRGQVSSLSNSREMRVGRKIFVIREALRKRRHRRNEKEHPVGEWRDRTGEDQPDPEPLEIESNLLPPGYTPPPDLTIVPPEGDLD